MVLFVLFFFVWFVVDRCYSYTLDKFTFNYYRYEFISDLIYIALLIIKGFLTSFDGYEIALLILFGILTIFHLMMAIRKHKISA